MGDKPVMVQVTREGLFDLQEAYNALEEAQQIANRAFASGDIFKAEDRPMIALAAKILQIADCALHRDRLTSPLPPITSPLP